MELTHHALAFVGCAMAIIVGKFTITLGVFSMIVEGSTPFYNIQKYLTTHELGSSIYYIINGIFGLLSFLFFRTLFNLYMVS